MPPNAIHNLYHTGGFVNTDAILRLHNQYHTSDCADTDAILAETLIMRTHTTLSCVRLPSDEGTVPVR